MERGPLQLQVVYEDPSEPGEENLAEKENEEGGNLLTDSGLSSSNFTIKKRLKCKACDGPHCEIMYVCTNAVMVS